jgi:deferrochelatase/peroxidase EfeB
MNMPAAPDLAAARNAREQSRLQDGIYITEKNKRPGRCYRLVLINIKQGRTPRLAKEAWALLWPMLQKLRKGISSDLTSPEQEDREAADKAELTCLLGFGARLFKNHPGVHPARAVVPVGKPPYDEPAFPTLPWAPNADPPGGEADFALQLIAETDLAVDRALMEVWMLVSQQDLALEIVKCYSGFNRADKRSWLGFHDGVNNIQRLQRREVIEVTVKDPSWMLGGTYMAFLRLAIDLAAWRAKGREEQEILVGRDKITGCPLAVVNGGRPVVTPGCPAGANRHQSPLHLEPDAPPMTETLLRQSHMHRTNPNRHGVQDGDNRIFRQGYEFVELLATNQLRVGLNFVSFQRDLGRLIGILRQISWLGNANFGGVPDGAPGAINFVSLVTGGFYAVPPNGERFPGEEILR